jgi:hypothetical protein
MKNKKKRKRYHRNISRDSMEIRDERADINKTKLAPEFKNDYEDIIVVEYVDHNWRKGNPKYDTVNVDCCEINNTISVDEAGDTGWFDTCKC